MKEANVIPALRPRSRSFLWVSILVLVFVTIRRLVSDLGSDTMPITLGLIVFYALLLWLSGWLGGKPRWVFSAYLCLQILVVEALGLTPPYEDTWVLFYFPLGIQVTQVYPLRQAMVWGVAFGALLMGTLIFTSDWISGIGYGLFYIAEGIFFVAYDFQYSRSEAASQESQDLLNQREAAHARLKKYSDQAEDVATFQEHIRLRRELHDSVSQILFSISLSTEATRMLLEKDPAQVPGRLEKLQELTSRALSQMRALISQWRPG